MKKINYDEFVEKLSQMEVGDTFDFFEDCDEETGETYCAYGAALIQLFEADMIVINYYGGSDPYIIDVTLPGYPIRSDNLESYFFRYGRGTETHVWVKD